MSGPPRPYYGHGQYQYPHPPPGPPPPHYPPPPGFHPPPPPGVVYYPYHPAYFYPYPPYPHPPPPGEEPAEAEEEPLDLEGELVVLPYRSYRWVPASTSQYSIPPGALRVGTDSDGSEIYAGRAHHEGDVIAAKVIPTKNACYISYGGEEVAKEQFEVLVPAMFSWQFSSNGSVPPGAVETGTTADGEKIYIGRVTADGHTTPGKIQPSHGCCYYPYDGEERSSTEYECLVLV